MKALALVPALFLAACAAPGPGTLAHLPPPPPPEEAPLPADVDAAIAAYRAFLAEASPAHPGYEQAVERLAELELARGAGQRPAPAAGEGPPADGDAATAIERLQDLVRRHPDDPRLPWWLYQLGRARQQAGHPLAALDAFTRLAEAHPDHPLALEARFRRAEILFARGRYREAEAAYARVLAGPDQGFHAIARYKHAWALLKDDRPAPALEEFLRLYRSEGLDDDRPPPANRAEQARRADLLRGIHRALDRLGGAPALAEASARLRHPERLYASLAEDYLRRERYLDAADTALAYGRAHPDDPRGARLGLFALEALRRGGLLRPARRLEDELAERYGRAGIWARADEATRRRDLPPYLDLLQRRARRQHARAQRLHGPAARTARRAAVGAYRRWLAIAPADHPQRVEHTYLLGELLEADGDLDGAAATFWTLALEHPEHPRAPQAAYAALLIRTRQLHQAPGPARTEAEARWRSAAGAFLAAFPDHPEARRVRAEWILSRLRAGEDATGEAAELLENTFDLPPVYPALLAAWLGDRAYDAGDFEGAARRYAQALDALGKLPARPVPAADGPRPPDGHRLQRRLAAAHYRAARRRVEMGELERALEHYRTAARAPVPEVAAKARQDALAVLIERQRWRDALAWLETLPPPPGDTPLAQRALVLEKLGRRREAAEAYRRLAQTSGDPALAREARLASARLFAEAGDVRAAVAQYKAFVYRHRPDPLAAQRARWALAELYRTLGEGGKRRFWLRRLVAAGEAKGAPDAVRPLAARAALILADEAAERYRAVALKAPLKRHFKRKKKRLQAALAAYARAARLEVAEVVTASTHHSAELYRDLARALLEAPLPKGLDDEEAEAYRLALEELAYPLEEQAIALHQRNAERAREGRYDRWVAASYRALAELLPVRYAKVEEVEAFDERLR